MAQTLQVSWPNGQRENVRREVLLGQLFGIFGYSPNHSASFQPSRSMKIIRWVNVKDSQSLWSEPCTLRLRNRTPHSHPEIFDWSLQQAHWNQNWIINTNHQPTRSPSWNWKLQDTSCLEEHVLPLTRLALELKRKKIETSDKKRSKNAIPVHTDVVWCDLKTLDAGFSCLGRVWF